MLVLAQTSQKLPNLHFSSNFLNTKTDALLASFARQSGLSKFLTECIISVFTHLYQEAHLSPPNNVRSITIFLDHMDGVAYTTGSPIDPDHKEIHLSISYFTRPELIEDKTALDQELKGVLVHELVHCFQYNSNGTAPGGFIEGIADYVRYKAHLSPSHWKVNTRPGKASKWDDGYQHTAFFLLWLNDKYGQKTTTTLNKACDDRKWSDKVFQEVTGVDLKKLWDLYEKEDDWSPY